MKTGFPSISIGKFAATKAANKNYLCAKCNCLFVCLFVFLALRPKSTAMVMAGRSVHLTTLFPGQA